MQKAMSFSEDNNDVRPFLLLLGSRYILLYHYCILHGTWDISETVVCLCSQLTWRYRKLWNVRALLIWKVDLVAVDLSMHFPASWGVQKKRRLYFCFKLLICFLWTLSCCKLFLSLQISRGWSLVHLFSSLPFLSTDKWDHTNLQA
jgi:hypothetical protein